MINNWSYRKYLLLFFILLGVCLAVYYPALHSGFVNWDDNDYIYENQVLIDHSWDNPFAYLKAIFSQKYRSIYSPITTLTFALEKGIYGFEKPGWWHLTNILLHKVNVFLIFFVLKRLSIGFWPSMIILLLFAVHPMHVEPVVWLTSRKDMLLGIFFLSGLLCYWNIYHNGRKNLVMYVFTWVFFILAVLSKVLALSFPLVLILIDIFELRGLNKKKLIEKIPFFLVALLIGLGSIWLANSFNEIKVENEYFHFFDRIFLASNALSTYFIKAVFPFEMLPLYPYPKELNLWYYLSSLVSGFSVFVLIWLSFVKNG